MSSVAGRYQKKALQFLWFGRIVNSQRSNFEFLVSVLAALAGKIFNPRAIGGFL